MSSPSAFRYTRGALHSGHTSMSSSLLSTFDPLQHEIAESGIYPRIYRKHPVRFCAERLAFYRILFGHDDRIGVRVLNVGGAIWVMIGERMSDEIETKG